MTAGSSPRPWHPLAVAELLVWRHGWWGPLVAAFLLATAALWHWELRPTASRIERAEAALRAPRAAPIEAAPRPGSSPDLQPLAAFRDVLTPYGQSTEVVRGVVAATLQELKWEQAEFQQTRDPVLGTVRLQITVPVVADYPQLRRGLERALREAPGLSLDQVSFRRDHERQAQLEARLKMSLWLASPEPGVRSDIEPRGGSR